MSIFLIVLIAMCVILLLANIISLLTGCESAFYVSALLFIASFGVLLAALFFKIIITASVGGCS